MKGVPYWQWLMLIYFVLVAVPVYSLHLYLKKKLLKHKSFLNLLLYFVAITGTALLMHIISMWLYFTFIFSKK